eukprot:CAMPEP_0176473434 /NCGR_PEP_ID=MMETSP0127-20121128/42312_1 /TAXON_ID=938130 /ORGANISM="Platyophrya macrostoma, Strain WH" /LENGTH=310 /DNA_ID=CAMNT_0017868445 /DNA_START=1 /DNA_END=933 /DNA_ORIENTATION=-
MEDDFFASGPSQSQGLDLPAATTSVFDEVIANPNPPSRGGSQPSTNNAPVIDMFDSVVVAAPAPAATPAPAAATPVPSAPAAATPVPSVPAAATPVPSAPAAATPVPSVPAAATPVPSAPAAATPVPSVPAPAPAATPAPAAATPVPSVPAAATPVSSAPAAATPGSALTATPVAPVVASPIVSTPIGTTAAEMSARSSVVAEQLRVIQERTAAIDKSVAEKSERLKKAAQEYLKEEANKRDAKLAIVRADHKKEQDAYEKRATELKQSGAVWQSIGLLVDLKKPNPHSKKTERMKSVLLNMEKQQTAVA